MDMWLVKEVIFIINHIMPQLFLTNHKSNNSHEQMRDVSCRDFLNRFFLRKCSILMKGTTVVC